MPRITVNASALRKSSDAYMELFNDDNLKVYALKGGRFEVVCGSTHAIAHSMQEVADKVNAMELHACALDGNEVVAGIQKRLGSQYRLEIHAAKDDKIQVVHSVEGSKESLACDMAGSIPVDVSCMNPGQRYSLSPNMFGGDYAVLIPMNTLGLPELSPSLSPNQMWETQPLTKGDVVQGLSPLGDVVKIIITQAYPNGSIQDNNGKIYSADEVAQCQFSKVQENPEPSFSEPDMPLYDSENIPSYNPTGEVEKVAPMIGNLSNYNAILEASGGILADFIRTASKFALADRCSLNKIRVSGIDKKGQATDGELEWNVKIASPYYKRSSLITIPMTMVKGNLDIGKYFIASTGQKFPLTVEALDAHLGRLADDPFALISKQSAHPSTLKSDQDIDAICAAVAIKKTAVHPAGEKDVGDVPKTADELDYDTDIKPVLQEKLEAGFESIARDYELQDQNSKEVEHKSRDGFIPFTDGGWEVNSFTYVSYLNSTGYSLPTPKSNKEKEDVVENAYAEAKKWFIKEHPEIAKELGEENIDYTTLYEKGYSAEAEELSEAEDVWMSDESVHLKLIAFYYTPDNPQNDNPGKHSLYMLYAVNMEAPYHRQQYDDIVISEEFPFDTIAEMTAKIDAFIAKMNAPTPTGTDKAGSKKTAVDAKEVAEKVLEKDKPLDNIPGGKAEGEKPSAFDKDQLEKGIKVEMEHTDNPEVAAEIATDHLAESPAHDKAYYDKLETKVEKPLEQKAETMASRRKVAMTDTELKAQGFILTDDSTNQWVKKVSDTEFEIFESGELNTIDLADYSEEDLENMATAYYGGWLKEIRETYGAEANQIIAEIISETEFYSQDMGKSSAKEVVAWDFTNGQDIVVGDTVSYGNNETGKVINITRVHDVYADEDEFDANQETYGNEGLSWEGNEIMTVTLDLGGIDEEKFVYEVTKVGSKKTAEFGDWGKFKDVLKSSETKEQAIKTLTDSGWVSPFHPNQQENPETVAEAVERLWSQEKAANADLPENKAIKIIDETIKSYVESLPVDIEEGTPDFYVGEYGEGWSDRDEIPVEEVDNAREVYILDTILSGQGFRYFEDLLTSAVREEIDADELSDDDLADLVGDWDADLGNALPENMGIESSEGFGDMWVVLYKDVVPSQEDVMKGREAEGQQVIPGLERGKASKKMALKTEENTPEVKAEIESAFETTVYADEIDDWDVVFEHGQWWINGTSFDEAKPVQYSVIDAEGPGSIDGFDFEQVS